MSNFTQFFSKQKKITALGIAAIGNVAGLLYTKTGPNEITVTAGGCKDRYNSVDLQLSADQAVAIPNTTDALHHLFLCDDGTVKVDTDFDATTILAGAVTAVRWIGFTKNNGSDVLDHIFNRENWLSMAQYQLTITANIPTSIVDVFPHKRVVEIIARSSTGNNYGYVKCWRSGMMIKEHGNSMYENTLIWHGEEIASSSGTTYINAVKIVR